MAKEPQAPERPTETPKPEPAPKKPFLSKKVIMFGVPVFLVQLVGIYFVIVKFIAPPGVAAANAAPEPDEKAKLEQVAPSIFVVKDVIVNPAGTNGTRFLLTTVGFEVTTPESQKELEKKEVQVRDVLNTILTSKGLDELVDVGQRETLRIEIASRISGLLKPGALMNVYFSKFIIQ